MSTEELKLIFSESDDRSIFISEYPYFGQDGNGAFYADFIEKNIVKYKSGVFEDVLELSIVTKFYSNSILKEVENVVYSRKHENVKLTCLDWMFCFFRNIPKEEFNKINNYGIEHFSSNLLKVQCVLNLTLIDFNKNLFKYLVRLLTRNDKAYAFYRVLNALESGQVAIDIFNINDLNAIKNASLNKCDVSEGQKNEISKSIDSLSKRLHT